MFSSGELCPSQGIGDIKLIALCRSSSTGFVSNEDLYKTLIGNGIRKMLTKKILRRKSAPRLGLQPLRFLGNADEYLC